MAKDDRYSVIELMMVPAGARAEPPPPLPLPEPEAVEVEAGGQLLPDDDGPPESALDPGRPRGVRDATRAQG
jgi:hypothetical protein